MKKIVLFISFIYLSFTVNGQIGFGTVKGIDLYQRYVNPEDNIARSSSGNTLLNIIWGPRVWIGGKNISFSMEAQINLGLTSLAIKDYKGLGAISFPVIAKINYKGLSGFYPGFANGVSLGVGMQWFKTELYYLSNEYKNKGVRREFNNTYITQLDFGYGSFGSSGVFYVRYGFNFETKSSLLNIGLVFNINNSYMKKNIKYRKTRS